jgi:hypothetical protein
MHKKDDELFKLALDYVKQADQDAEQNPTTEMIQIVVVEPSKTPYKKVIANDLAEFQNIVGGYIEILTIGKTETGGSIAITLNEEGKMTNLPFNRRIIGRSLSDVLVGTFFLTAYNMQGDNITLSDADCKRLIKKFNGLEVYL